MIKPAVLATIALGALLPAAAAADDPKALAATIMRDVCVETLPDFKTAIDRAADLKLLQRESDDVALDPATKVSLTVTEKQEIFGIEIEPLCVVNILNHVGKDLIETAEKLATEIGTETYRDGDGSDMEDDGIAWYLERNGQTVALFLNQDTSLVFWNSATLSLSMDNTP